MVEDQERLLKDQSDIERKYSINVKGLSVFHTVLEVSACTFTSDPCILMPATPPPPQCVKKRQPKAAEQIRKEFKLSESQ